MQIQQVIVTGQNQVELQDVEFNESLGPDEFLVDTECTFISAGTELANYSGKEPLVFQPGSWCAYPWRSGAERLQSQPPRRAPARQVLDLPVKDLYTSNPAHERWWQAVCRDYERKGPFDFRPAFDRKPMTANRNDDLSGAGAAPRGTEPPTGAQPPESGDHNGP